MLFYMGEKPGLSQGRRNTGWGFLRLGC